MEDENQDKKHVVHEKILDKTFCDIILHGDLVEVVCVTVVDISPQQCFQMISHPQSGYMFKSQVRQLDFKDLGKRENGDETLSRLVDMQVKVYMTNVIKTFKLDQTVNRKSMDVRYTGQAYGLDPFKDMNGYWILDPIDQSKVLGIPNKEGGVKQYTDVKHVCKIQLKKGFPGPVKQFLCNLFNGLIYGMVADFVIEKQRAQNGQSKLLNIDEGAGSSLMLAAGIDMLQASLI